MSAPSAPAGAGCRSLVFRARRRATKPTLTCPQQNHDGARCTGIVKSSARRNEDPRLIHRSRHPHWRAMTYIVGPSGCRKTTLISVIAGILTAEKGEVELVRNPAPAMGKCELSLFRRSDRLHLPALNRCRHSRVSRTYRPCALLANQSRPRAGRRSARCRRSAGPLNTFLPSFGLQTARRHREHRSEPQLIIFDEPTASLDAQTGQSAMELLREHALSPDRAVIVVTHDDRIFRFADRIVRMSDGRITGIELPPFTEGH